MTPKLAKNLVAVACGLSLIGCPGGRPEATPPADAFYFPTGVFHVDDPAQSEGVLFVVSSNGDRRFDYGSVTAINLGRLSNLPAFGSPVASSGPAVITELGIAPQSIAYITSFGAELAGWHAADGFWRLFTPARSEEQKLHAVDALPLEAADAAPELKCVPANGDGSRNCSGGGWSLVANQRDVTTSQPRGPAPIGVTVNQATAEVWVTHADPGDTPRGSAQGYTPWLIRTDAANPSITNDNFISLNNGGGTHAVAVSDRWAFASGRFHSTGTSLTRVVQSGEVPSGSRVVFATGMEADVRVGEARGIALSSDHRRLYVAARAPDALVVADVAGADVAAPAQPVVRPVRIVPLPELPQAVRALPRPGRSDLVLVACSSAGVLALYDDDVGDLVSQVTGLGQQPNSIAVDMRGAGARIFVTNFTDGRVAVIDIVDLNRPQEARVVAHLGRSQICVNAGFNDTSCNGVTSK